MSHALSWVRVVVHLEYRMHRAWNLPCLGDVVITLSACRLMQIVDLAAIVKGKKWHFADLSELWVLVVEQITVVIALRGSPKMFFFLALFPFSSTGHQILDRFMFIKTGDPNNRQTLTSLHL